MAIYSSNPSNNWTLSLKILLISTGVLSMAVALKLSAPVVADFVASEVPSFWSFVLSWLKPPYLYVLINGIIIIIVASSKLQQKLDDPLPPQSAAAVTAEEVKISGGGVRTDFAVYSGVVLTGYGYDPSEVAKVSVAATVESAVYTPAERLVEARVSEAEKENRETAGLQRKDSALEYFFPNENEKPPVSARFGHRKAAKASPEGTVISLPLSLSLT